MKCRNCGCELLENDTFCTECGTKVEIEKCPSCGESLREGAKFCPKCGYKLVNDTEVNKKSSLEDDEIPVTSVLSTVDIPFDIIERNIIREAAFQISSEQPNPDFDRDYEEYDNYEEYSDNQEEFYSDDENVSEDEYEEEYYEEYSDEYSNEFDEGEYEDEFEEGIEEIEPSLLSRLFTAGIIVLGIIILLIVASVFFRYRNNKIKENNNKEEITTEQEVSSNVEDDIKTDPIIGTITITEDVNIRDNASTENSNVIKVARIGEKYEYYGYTENWVHIKIDDNSDGYVYSKYISID